MYRVAVHKSSALVGCSVCEVLSAVAAAKHRPSARPFVGPLGSRVRLGLAPAIVRQVKRLQFGPFARRPPSLTI